MVVKKESARTRVLDELKRIANNNCPYFLSTSLSNRICNTQDWYLFKKSKKRYFETVFEYKTKILKFTPEFYFENDIEFPGEFYNSPVRVLRSIVRSCVLLDLGIGTDQIQPDWTFRSGKTTLMIDDFTSLPEDIEQDFIVTTIDRKQLLERGGKCVVIPLTCQSKGSKKVLSEFYGANTSYFLKSYNSELGDRVFDRWTLEGKLHSAPTLRENCHLDKRLYPGGAGLMTGKQKNWEDEYYLDEPDLKPEGWIFGVYKDDFGVMDCNLNDLPKDF